MLGVFLLQAVVGPRHGVLDGVGAGEELVALLLVARPHLGVPVFVQEFPHVVGKVQEVQVVNKPGKG